MDVSLLTIVDIENILSIEKRSFQRTWDRSIFMDEFASNSSFFYGAKYASCEYNDAILGYICYRLYKNMMHLLKLAVDPMWRRRGIASLLMSACLNREVERGISSSILEVRSSNSSAICFYDRLGFHVIGKRPNYYSDTQEDALIMMRNLKEE